LVVLRNDSNSLQITLPSGAPILLPWIVQNR
jgi:hypothetical protein